MANLKPLLEELKSLKDNINTQNIKNLLQSNYEENKHKIEAKLLSLAESTKNNPVINEYVEQVLKAELTTQALVKLNTKFPDHEIVKKIMEVKAMLLKEEAPVVAEEPAEVSKKAKTATEKTTTTPNSKNAKSKEKVASENTEEVSTDQ